MSKINKQQVKEVAMAKFAQLLDRMFVDGFEVDSQTDQAYEFLRIKLQALPVYEGMDKSSLTEEYASLTYLDDQVISETEVRSKIDTHFDKEEWQTVVKTQELLSYEPDGEVFDLKGDLFKGVAYHKGCKVQKVNEEDVIVANPGLDYIEIPNGKIYLYHDNCPNVPHNEEGVPTDFPNLVRDLDAECDEVKGWKCSKCGLEVSVEVVK